MLLIIVAPFLHSPSSLVEDHLAEIVASTTILDDFLAEVLESHRNAFMLGGCGVVVGVLLVVDWVALEVAEELGQVLGLAVSFGPLVILRTELGLGCVLCGRLVRGWLILVALCLDGLLFDFRRFKFFVFDL